MNRVRYYKDVLFLLHGIWIYVNITDFVENVFQINTDGPRLVIPPHCDDAIMDMIASQITSLTVVYSTVYSDADQRKHQSSVSLAFVRGIHRGRMASNAESISIWWRRYEISLSRKPTAQIMTDIVDWIICTCRSISFIHIKCLIMAWRIWLNKSILFSWMF